MASELYVETLKGLTSGANANKVIIPSGQTLDASAGGHKLNKFYRYDTSGHNYTDKYIKQDTGCRDIQCNPRRRIKHPVSCNNLSRNDKLTVFWNL